MTTPSGEISSELPCHRCGYDLRAHPEDGRCPECGASVAEAKRVAATPHRPAWRDSDPRWRRRMLAGVWLLVFLPLMDALTAFGWTSSVPVPAIFDYRQTVRTLQDTFIASSSLYRPIVFCMGTALLFSSERRRRSGRLDWTRRWGVLCTYVVLLLETASVLLIAALVTTGIAALFLSMPPQYQPRATGLLVDLGTAYLRYGPYPKDIAIAVESAFASIVVVLACIPLFEALRSTGLRWLAGVLIAPLVLFGLMHLFEAAQVGMKFMVQGVTLADLYDLGGYFRPRLLINYLTRNSIGLFAYTPGLYEFLVEATKWCIVLGIAVWLSIAQFRRRSDLRKETA